MKPKPLRSHTALVLPVLAMPALACLGWAVVILDAAPAHACSCMAASVEERRDGSAAVFEGRALTVEEPAAQNTPVRVRFRVTRAWKGVTTEEVTIATPANSAMCGVHFEVGRSYLVFAHAGRELLQVGLCGGSAPSEAAGDDLAVLGIGVTPVEPGLDSDEPVQRPPERPARGGCASCAIGAARSEGLGLGALTGLVCGVVVLGGLRRRVRAQPPRRRSRTPR